MANYDNLTKEQLIERLKKLEKKKSGLIIHEQPEDVELDVYDKGKLPILKHLKSKDVVNGGKDHLLIEGDNLHTLMALQTTHRGLVDVIYIDPPYNTGNKDFKYNDHFVDKEDGWRHNKWLSFMSRRLKLARELMSDSGVIFISIDDNEQAQLKLLCDDIFGEDNFLMNMIRNIPDGSNISNVSITHEYVLVYTKNIFTKLVPKNKNNTEIESRLTKRGNVRKQLKFFAGLKADEGITKKITGIIGGASEPIKIIGEISFLNGVLEKDVILEAEWAAPNVIIDMMAGKEVVDNKGQKYKRIVFKTNGVPWVYKKREVGLFRSVRNYSNETYLIDDILGEGKFNNPKPIDLVKDLVELNTNKNAIVLDFFAGSGTTGQAVLELNKEDGGQRQFILATNNENNICEEVTRERLKRVMNGYTNSKEVQIAGLGDSLRYFKTSFVSNAKSDTQLRVNLMDGYADLICIMEDTFDLVKETACYKIFKGGDKTVAFVSSDKSLAGLVDYFKEVTGKKKVYKFELEDARDPDFEELFDGVTDVKFDGVDKIIRSYIKLMRKK